MVERALESVAYRRHLEELFFHRIVFFLAYGFHFVSGFWVHETLALTRIFVNPIVTRCAFLYCLHFIRATVILQVLSSGKKISIVTTKKPKKKNKGELQLTLAKNGIEQVAAEWDEGLYSVRTVRNAMKKMKELGDDTSVLETWAASVGIMLKRGPPRPKIGEEREYIVRQDRGRQPWAMVPLSTILPEGEIPKIVKLTFGNGVIMVRTID